MELKFIKSGDYYIPDIQLQNPNIRLGKWGLMRKSYLRIAQPILFSEMVLSETLYPHCAEIEAAAKSRMNTILPQLMKHYGVTERLKAANQLEWVRQMNACVAQGRADLQLSKEKTMGLIKLIIKLLVLPLIVAVTLIQWVGIFFTQFSTVIFNLLAGLMFLITIAGWMFGISAGAETLQLLAVAFVVFIIPHIAEWLIIRIAVINYGLRDFIKS